jgi:hypothetical protein
MREYKRAGTCMFCHMGCYSLAFHHGMTQPEDVYRMSDATGLSSLQNCEQKCLFFVNSPVCDILS